ncbi:metallophosphoesterase [Candidatus Bathyarchaeota archaeon]|nr:metallophosphoesterase [Candidatus Bathyarchaeota archaeon]
MDEVNVRPIRPYQALLLTKGYDRVIVISDLHLGWEITLNREGFHFPTQMKRLLKKTLTLIKIAKPDRVIILGDLKHTVSGVEVEEWRDIPEFLEALKKRVSDVTVVPGNHDGNLSLLLPDGVSQASATGITLWGEVGLFHGHSWPDPKLLGCKHLVMGHIHPIISFRDPSGLRINRQVWIKAECDGEKLGESVLRHLGIRIEKNVKHVFLENFDLEVRSSSLIILPSFNEVLGGIPINLKENRDKRKSATFIGPILRSGCVNMMNAEVYLLDGTFLGKVRQLQALNY